MLVIGEPIDGRTLEKETSTWTGDRFANFCDGLVWAEASRLRSDVPSFNALVNAPDGGVDAEVFYDLAGEIEDDRSPLIGPGRNVIQYKKRDAIASDRRRIVAGLKRQLKGALASIEAMHNRTPTRYVLCANVNLGPKVKSALRQAICEGSPHADSIAVAILGAPELAQFLNDNPHLRAAYFGQVDFRTWMDARRILKDSNRSVYGRDLDLIGREDVLGRLRSMIADPDIRVVALWGQHHIGKSSLALEATADRSHTVAVAADPEALSPGQLRALVHPRRETICIVDDPELDGVEPLIQTALTEPKLKLILTVPSPADAPTPHYGYDNRVQHIEVEPINLEDSRRLLRAVARELPFEIEDWITEKSGGVPGVVLAAARVGEGLRIGSADFRDQVGQEHAKRIEARLGEHSLRVAEAFSLLTYVGVAGKVESHAQALRELFLGVISEAELGDEMRRLSEAGILRRRGSYVEMTIPLLAEHLAARVAGSDQRRIWALFPRLDEAGRIRLLRRFAHLDTASVQWFWDALLAHDGPFAGEQLLLGGVAVPILAGAAPESFLATLKPLLEGMSLERRREIAGDQRWDLVHAIEQLLFRRRTSGDALRLMGLLAEAGNESVYADNASEVFAECFAPTHPLMPLALESRLQILRELVRHDSVESRRVALRGIKVGSRGYLDSFSVRQPLGAAPFDRPPRVTWSEAHVFAKELVQEAFGIAEGDDAVSLEASAMLPELVVSLARFAPLEYWKELFQRLVDMALRHPRTSSVSAVAGVGGELLEGIGEERIETAISQDNMATIDFIRSQLERLETARFGIRLRRWLGSGHRFHSTAEEEKAILDLATEALRQPELLAEEEVWEWIHSPEGRRSPDFFEALGRGDSAGLFRERFEAEGAKPENAEVVSSYWRGWAARDHTSAEKRLDELTAGNAIDGKTIVLATWKLRPSEAGAMRIIDQLRLQRVSPDLVARVMLARDWMEALTPDTIEKLFREIAGTGLAGGEKVVELLHIWVDLKRPMTPGLEELTWQIIEADRPMTFPISWELDRLAAQLVLGSSGRGFALIEQLLGCDREGKWKPLDRHGSSKSWSSLWSLDKTRLLGIVLRASGDPRLRFELSSALKGRLNPFEDRAVILDFARQSVEYARFVAGCLIPTANGFWSLAGDLMALYPDDDDLWYEIAGAIEGSNTVTVGPRTPILEDRKRQVKQALGDPTIPAAFRRRLAEWMERAEDGIGRGIVWDYNEDIDDLVRYVRDSTSPQRIWAIGRILKNCRFEEIRKLLRVEDIEDALPSVDISLDRRRALEAALPIWKYGS
ncbi:MAG: hypothetical protein HYX75_17620 [Acidobacteria bacterium]|nr:hypothetical protein [Acidobacteriota bacterium]